MMAYPKYKDSGIEWIGEIPEHWKVTALKFFADVTLGKMLTNVDKGGYIKKPYLRSQNIQIKNVDVSDVKEMWFAPNELEKLFLNKGDLLLSEGGDVGRTSIWNNELEECYIQNSVNRVKFYTESPYYYLYLSLLYHAVGYYDSVVNRVSIPHLTKEKLQSIAYLKPPVEEQTQIANFLDQKTKELDTAIEQLQALITLLQEERTSLINEAVTKGINREVRMKDSGIEWIGEVPEHWEVIRLKFLTEILRGKFTHRPRNDKRLYNGDYPFIQTGDVSRSKKYIESYSQTLNELGYKVSKEFPKGTLVMTIAANIGDVAILNFQGCFPDSIVGFYPRGNNSVNFLYYNFKILKPRLFKEATLNTQLNLSIDRISNIYTVAPPHDEQERIVQHIEKQTHRIDTEIDYTQQEIALLKEYKQSLITEAVTGKIDVRSYTLTN